MSATPATDGRKSILPVHWDAMRLPAPLQALLAASETHALDAHVSVFEGFGSFHSENVEDLMSMDEATYTPPTRLPAFARRLLSKSEIARVALVQPGGSAAHVKSPESLPCCKRRRGESRRCGGGGGAVPSAELASGRGETVAIGDTRSGAGYDDDATADDSDGSCSGSSRSSDNARSLPPPARAWGPASEQRVRELVDCTVTPCELGTAFRAEHFSITPNMVFINHGAFGSTLAGAMLIKRLYEEHMEREVVEFVDRELLPLIVYSIRSLSRFLHADPRQVVLLQNATFALNCAMRMIEKDDVVAFLDTEYLAVYKMMWFRCEEVGATLHEVGMNKYLHDPAIMGDDAALTAEICRQLPANCTTVVLDYVTSTSAVCFPVFTHIIPALRRRGVHKIIVDGAHAPLQVELNFNALPAESQPTVFVGNLHKWFSSPKSAGFFWVRADDADRMRSVVLSHGAGEGLLSEFIWDGTRDYGAYLSIPAIVDFWERQGHDRVRGYCAQLLSSAADMLTDAFHSRRVARHAPFMSLVELPEKLQDDFITAKYIQDSLHDIFRVEVPVKRIDSRYYVRISAFVYNTPEEYLYLREAILSIANKWAESPERRQLESRQLASTAAGSGAEGQPAAVPCDERIRRQGGCGVSGLDPSLKRKKTSKFA
ncbi:Aminotransferase class-V [Novymonas esmeraldas]|uniref:Aminotransferase class-V n=1 Tax=Novymonas esmeraldas TaxID=1808958 RepID=A0AAW0EWC8_9TRYP